MIDDSMKNAFKDNLTGTNRFLIKIKNLSVTNKHYLQCLIFFVTI